MIVRNAEGKLTPNISQINRHLQQQTRAAFLNQASELLGDKKINSVRQTSPISNIQLKTNTKLLGIVSPKPGRNSTFDQKPSTLNFHRSKYRGSMQDSKATMASFSKRTIQYNDDQELKKTKIMRKNEPSRAQLQEFTNEVEGLGKRHSESRNVQLPDIIRMSHSNIRQLSNLSANKIDLYLDKFKNSVNISPKDEENYERAIASGKRAKPYYEHKVDNSLVPYTKSSEIGTLEPANLKKKKYVK